MKNNWVKKIVGIIANNFGLKLLAVIVSCGLWFVVSNINDPVGKRQFYNVPVSIINDDLVTSEGKVYEVIEGTNYVNVTVIGKSTIIKEITKEDLRAVADMSQLTFMNTVGIVVSSTRNNSELEFRTNIDNVKLSIEDMTKAQKMINTSTVGTPAEGYVVGKVEASQNVVQLSGPESLIAQIDHVEAVANIDGYSSDINTSVELKLYDANGKEIKSSTIKMNISTVNVAVTILATKEVPINIIASDQPEEGYIASSHVMCEPSTVLIAGRKAVLDAVSKISISDPALSLADRTESLREEINIKKYLPSGTQFADSSFSGNVMVTVGIEPIVTRELQIPKKNFALGNMPEGFNIFINELEDAESFTIRISGVQNDVNAVNPEDIIGVVDMDILLESINFEQWAAGAYEGEITFNLPETVVLEERYKFTIILEDIIIEENE